MDITSVKGVDEPVGGGVTLDDERQGEVREAQHRPRGDRQLEGVEGRGCLLRPGEPLFVQASREGRRDRAVVAHELAVMPGKAGKTADGAC